MKNNQPLIKLDAFTPNQAIKLVKYLNSEQKTLFLNFLRKLSQVYLSKEYDKFTMR